MQPGTMSNSSSGGSFMDVINTVIGGAKDIFVAKETAKVAQQNTAQAAVAAESVGVLSNQKLKYLALAAMGIAGLVMVTKAID